MGTKYAAVSVSGYNATPPADDGTVSEANKLKWSTIKTKLPDPLKTALEAIDSALQTHFNVGPQAYTSNQTLGASHYGQFIQVSGSGVTLTLSDAATLGTGWHCFIVSTDSSNTTTLGRATGGDTINASAADYTLRARSGIFVFVNAAATGFEIRLLLSPTSGNTLTSVLNMSGGAINFAEGSDVASAATTDIWSTTGNTVHVTGTTTISSFGTAPQAGAWRLVIFDSALTLTNGANLNLGGGNFTTVAGEMALVYADTTTQFDVYFLFNNNQIATQSTMESASSTRSWVSPGVFHYHPGSAKAWVEADAAGNIGASYNTTSITDTGTGQLTWTLGTAMSSSGYPVVASARASGGDVRDIVAVTQSETVITFKSNDETNAAADPTEWYAVAFGDQ